MFGRKKKKQQDKQVPASQVQPAGAGSRTRGKQPPSGRAKYSIDPTLAAKLGLPPSVFLGSLPAKPEERPVPPKTSKKPIKRQAQVRPGTGWRHYLGRILGTALILIPPIVLFALSLGAALQLHSQMRSDEIAQVIVQTDVVERRLDDLLCRVASQVDLRQLPEGPTPISVEPLGDREPVDWLEERTDRLASQIAWLEEQLLVQPTDFGSSQAEFFQPPVLPEYIGWPIVDNELRQRVAKVWRKLLSLNQRLSTLHERIQPISSLTLKPPEVHPDQAELPADGQASTSVTIELLNAEGQPYPKPLEVTIRIAEGEGVLEYEGQVGQEMIVPDADSEIHITYRAGEEPGPVTIVARAGAVEGSTSLTLINIAPAQLNLQLSKPIFRADGTDQVILTIQVLKTDGGRVPGDTAITISAEPPDVVTLDNTAPQAHNGEATVTIIAKPGITEDTQVILMVTAGAVRDQAILEVAPGPPPPVTGPQCVVNDGVNTTVYRAQKAYGEDFLFDHPAGNVIGCPSDLTGNIIPVTVTIWIPAQNISDSVLAVAEAVQIVVGPEGPAAGGPTAVLSPNADGLLVERTGREEGDYVEVLSQGWMLSEALTPTE